MFKGLPTMVPCFFFESQRFQPAPRGGPERPRKRITVSGVYALSAECILAASHVIPGCPPCDRLHGHTWTVKAHWSFTVLDEHGMGVNFRTLKELLRTQVRVRFDHRHLNDIPPFDKIPATAENLAKEVFNLLKASFDPGPGGWLARVEVWEGPVSCAAYEERADA
jgi:6-pyruvoyltetrahydropterin/6-carboxytetrahydropterin synthase